MWQSIKAFLKQFLKSFLQDILDVFFGMALEYSPSFSVLS